MSASRSPLFKRPRLLWAWAQAPLFWRRLFARGQDAHDGHNSDLSMASHTEQHTEQHLQSPAPPAPNAAVHAARALAAPSTSAPIQSPVDGGGFERMPRPAIRWIGPRAGVALRSFDYAADIEAVAAFQKDNYELNFPEFTYSRDFESAFRLDIRRASLDPNHAIYVLDEPGAWGLNRVSSGVIGFLWLVVCENGWTSERYGYINNLYLLPQRRGGGLAGEMMAQSDAFFRARRIRRVRLTVTASNARAVGLYEKSGFATTRWEMEKDVP